MVVYFEAVSTSMLYINLNDSITDVNLFGHSAASAAKSEGKGVKGSGAMTELSVRWNAISLEERMAYETLNFTEVPNKNGLRAHSESILHAEKRVDKWMDTWQKKVTMTNFLC